MTEQEVFDTVVSHLRAQGHKAESLVYEDPLRKGEPQCVYLDPDTGDRCAAGCLIEKEEYNPMFEGKSIIAILGSPIYGAPQGMVDRLYPVRSIIIDLQQIHDKEDVEDWEYYWQYLADRKGLKYLPPSEGNNG